MSWRSMILKSFSRAAAMMLMASVKPKSCSMVPLTALANGVSCVAGVEATDMEAAAVLAGEDTADDDVALLADLGL